MSTKIEDSPASQHDAVKFFSVGIWKAMETLPNKRMRAAVAAADKVLGMHPYGSAKTTLIKPFGKCSYAKCTAIVAVYICSRTPDGDDSTNSPILAAARAGRILAGISPSNAGSDAPGAVEKP